MTMELRDDGTIRVTEIPEEAVRIAAVPVVRLLRGEGPRYWDERLDKAHARKKRIRDEDRDAGFVEFGPDEVVIHPRLGHRVVGVKVQVTDGVKVPRKVMKNVTVIDESGNEPKLTRKRVEVIVQRQVWTDLDYMEFPEAVKACDAELEKLNGKPGERGRKQGVTRG